MSEAKPITLFSQWLTDHATGGLDATVAEAMAKVAQEVHLLDKAGTVTVELRFAKNNRRVVITPTVKAKPPTAAEESSMWFVSDKGLSRDDPFFLTFDDLEDEAARPNSQAMPNADPATGEIHPD